MSTMSEAATLSSPGRPQSKPSIFVALDGLRGVAAIAVVLWHAEILTGIRPQSGYLAVDLFFCLSGFVIAHSYDRRMAASMGGWEFMRLRLIRLYPLYLAGLLIALGGVTVSFLVGAKTNWTEAGLILSFVLALFYLPTPPQWSVNGTTFPLNSPSWSLLFELLINIAYAFLHRHLTLKVLALIAAVAAVALIGMTIHYNTMNTGFLWSAFLGGFPRVLFSFTVGVILLRLFVAGRITLNIGTVWPVVITLAILCYGPPDAWRAAYDLVAALVIFPLVTLAGASCQPKRLAKAYSFLGLLSYAIYVLHVPLLAVTASGMTKLLGIDLASVQPWAGILFTLLALLASWICVRFYDIPTRRFLANRIRTGREKARQAAAL